MAKPFPRDNHLTAIAVAFKNPEVSLIADQVFPRVKVGKREFSYYSYPEEKMYSVPITRVGEHDRVNRTTVNGTKLTESVFDDAQAIPLTRADLDEAPQGVNPEEKATERATNIILLGREQRAAALAFTAANYPTGNKKDLTAGSNVPLDDEDSNPIEELLSGLDAMLVRGNYLAIGQYTWRKLSTNPKLVSAALGNSGTAGVITRQRLAELLEVNEIFVGAGLVNIAKPGKTPELARIWGNSILAYFRDSTIDTSGGVSFGFTAQHGDRVAGSSEIKAGDMGLYGGKEVLVGESTKELIIAPRAAFLWSNAVTPPA